MNRTGLYTLIVLNLAVLSLSVGQLLHRAFAQGELPVLRGRALEIVDSQDRLIRADFGVKFRWPDRHKRQLLDPSNKRHDQLAEAEK